MGAGSASDAQPGPEDPSSQRSQLCGKQAGPRDLDLDPSSRIGTPWSPVMGRAPGSPWTLHHFIICS